MISAYKVLERVFDYDWMPIAPIFTPALLYNNPSKHGTFSGHGMDAVSLGLAMEDYHNRELGQADAAIQAYRITNPLSSPLRRVIVFQARTNNPCSDKPA